MKKASSAKSKEKSLENLDGGSFIDLTLKKYTIKEEEEEEEKEQEKPIPKTAVLPVKTVKREKTPEEIFMEEYERENAYRLRKDAHRFVCIGTEITNEIRDIQNGTSVKLNATIAETDSQDVEAPVNAIVQAIISENANEKFSSRDSVKASSPELHEKGSVVNIKQSTPTRSPGTPTLEHRNTSAVSEKVPSKLNSEDNLRIRESSAIPTKSAQVNVSYSSIHHNVKFESDFIPVHDLTKSEQWRVRRYVMKRFQQAVWKTVHQIRSNKSNSHRPESSRVKKRHEWFLSQEHIIKEAISNPPSFMTEEFPSFKYEFSFSTDFTPTEAVPVDLSSRNYYDYVDLKPLIEYPFLGYQKVTIPSSPDFVESLPSVNHHKSIASRKLHIPKKTESTPLTDSMQRLFTIPSTPSFIKEPSIYQSLFIYNPMPGAVCHEILEPVDESTPTFSFSHRSPVCFPRDEASNEDKYNRDELHSAARDEIVSRQVIPQLAISVDSAFYWLRQNRKAIASETESKKNEKDKADDSKLAAIPESTVSAIENRVRNIFGTTEWDFVEEAKIELFEPEVELPKAPVTTHHGKTFVLEPMTTFK